MKILLMSYLIIMKWVFLRQIFNLDNNFDEDDPDTIIPIRLLAWYIQFEKRKEHKKNIREEFKKNINEELMAIA